MTFAIEAGPAGLMPGGWAGRGVQATYESLYRAVVDHPWMAGLPFDFCGGREGEAGGGQNFRGPALYGTGGARTPARLTLFTTPGTKRVPGTYSSGEAGCVGGRPLLGGVESHLAPFLFFVLRSAPQATVTCGVTTFWHGRLGLPLVVTVGGLMWAGEWRRC